MSWPSEMQHSIVREMGYQCCAASAMKMEAVCCPKYPYLSTRLQNMASQNMSLISLPVKLKSHVLCITVYLIICVCVWHTHVHVNVCEGERRDETEYY